MSFRSKKAARAGIIFFFAVAAFFLENTAAPPSTAERDNFKMAGYHRVVQTIDGDTILVDMDGKPEKVRLIGLDTPETVDPRRPVQCFGREATAKAKNILSGQKVRIEPDMSQDSRDRYGRLLAYVFLPDGTLFNKMMIEEGYGHEYTYTLPYKYQAEFKAAETRARELKKGLWANGVCGEME